MARLICPNCAARITVEGSAGAATCPQCGHALPTAAAVHAVASQAAAYGPDPADAGLVADLREAFESDAQAFRSAGPCRLSRSAGSSETFSRTLAASTLPAGTRLDDFEIVGELGHGGMGVVYRARQLSLGRQVALKVLPGYSHRGPMAVQRFQVEAQAAARLHHSNIVPIYAQGEHDGRCYYAMELVDGIGLDTVIRERADLLRSNGGRRTPATRRTPTSTAASSPAAAEPVWTPEDYRHLARLMAEVADALECAHRHGVIHRDVKPHNLLLGANDRLRLTDFGLARLVDEPHLTVSGEVMGTPAYLSPEQVRGDAGRIDHRTDIYSLGVTLYELTTRRKPFDGQTREQIITGICAAEPVAPRRLEPRIPIDLETICLRAMEKEPQRRYPTATLMAEDLRRFAAGRPILSRRTRWPQKTARWVRRHKSLTAATAATAAVVLLAVGLAWSISAARHREARQLLHDAYEQLAYRDYRTPELVRADLKHAAALGADPHELDLARALASLGATDEPNALRYLDGALQRDPADLRARYLLAWAQWRARDYAAARATFAQAEQRGPPNTADAWFFRGLAIHFDEPTTAIASYRQANALRAREHAFYPQAVLHLARARNQQIYATRSLEAFAEADSSLRQLIEHEQYGAYPYYLLSITHRLAAEIYSGSRGTRDDSLVAEHYSEALHWARRGQTIRPDNDRPITAEAECLESMGRYEEALAARSRAIAVATKDRARCESYHYRWRLHYWLGELDAALEDVVLHAACMPDSRFYAHVYPALILAEIDRVPEALAQARALAEEAPDSAQAVLWSATCLRLLGRPEEAQTLLMEQADRVDFAAELIPPQSEEWLRTLYAYCIEGGSLDALDELAAQAARPWKLWGEAHFHAAALRLADGDRAGALRGFERACRSFDSELRYTFHGEVVFTRMQQDPAWPPWIVAAGQDVPGPPDQPERERWQPAGNAEGGNE